MRYADFERRVVQMATSATDSCRRDFAIDTIKRLHNRAAKPLSSELTASELHLAQQILEGFVDGDPQMLLQTLSTLHDSMTVDDVRAIEFHPAITEWLCAIEHWIRYRQSGDPVAIASVGINMVNIIDFEIGGQSDEYSIDNMLGSPAMCEEYERQQRLLGAEED